MYRRFLGTVALAAVALTAAAAQAGVVGSVNMSYLGDRGNTGGVSVTLSPGGTLGTINLNQGGPFLWQLNSISLTNPSQDSQFAANVGTNQLVTFCIQLNSYISGTADYSIIKPISEAPDLGYQQGAPYNSLTAADVQMGAVAADLIALMWQNHGAAAMIGGFSGADGDAAAAFQLAIWKIEYDAKTYADNSALHNLEDFNSGTLRATGSSTTIDAAEALIKEAVTQHLAVNSATTYTRATMYALSARSSEGYVYQDQLVGYLNVPTTPFAATAPEPGSLLIWTVIGAAVAYPGWKRRKQQPTNV